MTDSVVSTGSSVISGTNVSIKTFKVQSGPSFIQNDAANSNIFTIGTHTLRTGEKIRVFSDDGDLPENIESNTVYFVIRISSTEIKLASSVTVSYTHLTLPTNREV